MFDLGHLILFCVFLCIPAGLAVLLTKLKVNTKWVLYVCMGLCLISEIIKTHYFVRETEEGYYMFKNSMPLHLCSIQIIFIFIIGLTKKQKTREFFVSFFIPTALMGAFMALVIPTTYLTYGAGHPLTYQYFGFHGMLVFLALYLYIKEYKRLNVKSYLQCLSLIALLFVGSIYVNSALQDGMANFFYTAKPPIENLPVLNLNNGWLFYMFSLICVGVLLISCAYLPILIRSVRQRFGAKKDKPTPSV